MILMCLRLRPVADGDPGGRVVRTWIATAFGGGRIRRGSTRSWRSSSDARKKERCDASGTRQLSRADRRRNSDPHGRPGAVPAAAKKGEGLNLPDQVCPGCVQRCAQTCSRNTKEIIASGRAHLGQRAADEDRSSIAALIDHHPESRRHARRRAEGLPGSARVPLCQRVREFLLGAVVRHELAAHRSRSARCRLSVGAASTEPRQRKQPRGVRRRAGSGYGDQRRRAPLRRSGGGEDRYRRSGAGFSSGGAIVKVILETALLDDNQKPWPACCRKRPARISLRIHRVWTIRRHGARYRADARVVGPSMV